MGLADESIRDFVGKLGSDKPTPGGGSAAALVAAVGIALGDMVACLTVGKKKYKENEDKIKELKTKAEALELAFLALIQEDVEAFEPLSTAYKLGPGKEMEAALKGACAVPLDIMRKCGEAIELQLEFARLGSRIVISDAGCGAVLCKAAMQAASLNVYINAQSMEDKAYAQSAVNEAENLLEKYVPLADKVFDDVIGIICHH